ncbi:hypothetical protein [Nocardia sp. NPDC004604]|uniref:hypothetical protein n=1 Tax=Nocardia sp. NPDC004604 TaxID=3157013 RepID=UPI0033AC765D
MKRIGDPPGRTVVGVCAVMATSMPPADPVAGRAAAEPAPDQPTRAETTAAKPSAVPKREEVLMMSSYMIRGCNAADTRTVLLPGT